MVNITKEVNLRKKTTTLKRAPFFKCLIKYLPEKNVSVIVDLGCGDNMFSESLGLIEKYKDVVLLDASKDALKKISNKYKTIHYEAPAKLPLDNNSVDFLHCSHLIEHLDGNDFKKLMIEIDRVVKSRGNVIISTPLDWELFYGDISHVRPYPLDSIMSMFVFKQKNPTNKGVSLDYEVKEVIPRYYNFDEYCFSGSDIVLVELVIRAGRFIKTKIFKISRFKRNGYTVVLTKK